MQKTYPTGGSKLLIMALLLLPLGACDSIMGKEIARLPLNATNPAGSAEQEVSLPLKKDETVAIWSDMDLEYRGESPVRFQLTVLKNNAPFQQVDLDPTNKNVTVGEVKTTVNDHVTWRFAGKNGSITLPEDATYTFRARLVTANNPTLILRKAELVLKK